MAAAARVLKAAVFQVRRPICMAGAQKVLRFCIIFAAGIGVFYHQRHGRARGEALVNAREEMHLVRLCALGAQLACSAALIHLARNVCLVHRHARGKARKCGAHGRAMAFAKDGKRNGARVCVVHPMPSPIMARSACTGAFSSR